MKRLGISLVYGSADPPPPCDRAGGVEPSTSLMEYRLENREFKARIELLVYRALVDELRLNEDLVNYANESFLRETGMNSRVANIIYLTLIVLVLKIYQN